MPRVQLTVLAILLALAMASGCARWPGLRDADAAAAPLAELDAEQDPEVAAQAAVDRVGSSLATVVPAAAAVPATVGAPLGVPPAAPAVQTPEGAMAGIMSELQSLGAIDEAQQQQLLADLQKTDPKYWPLIMQSFKTALAQRRAESGGAEPAALPRPGSPPSLAQATPAGMPPPTTAVSVSPPPTLPALAPQMGDVPGAAIVPLPGVAGGPTALPVLSGPHDPGPAPVVDTTASSTASNSASRIGALPPAASASDPDGELASAIAALESSLAGAGDNAETRERQVQLRMLYLMAGRKDEALRPVQGFSAAEHDYWSEQIFALAALRDRQAESDASRRATLAGEHLRMAAARLAELGMLEVQNLAFCTEVKSFGVYKKFPDSKFTAGQEVLLYAELENFKSEQTPKGWHTAMRSSYQVLDDQGRVVDEQRFELTEEYCANPRRDFFIRYFLYLPQKINPGHYTLQLTIEDTLSHKIGQGSIDVTISGG